VHVHDEQGVENKLAVNVTAEKDDVTPREIGQRSSPFIGAKLAADGVPKHVAEDQRVCVLPSGIRLSFDGFQI